MEVLNWDDSDIIVHYNIFFVFYFASFLFFFSSQIWAYLSVMRPLSMSHSFDSSGKVHVTCYVLSYCCARVLF